MARKKIPGRCRGSCCKWRLSLHPFSLSCFSPFLQLKTEDVALSPLQWNRMFPSCSVTYGVDQNIYVLKWHGSFGPFKWHLHVAGQQRYTAISTISRRKGTMLGLIGRMGWGSFCKHCCCETKHLRKNNVVLAEQVAGTWCLLTCCVFFFWFADCAHLWPFWRQVGSDQTQAPALYVLISSSPTPCVVFWAVKFASLVVVLFLSIPSTKDWRCGSVPFAVEQNVSLMFCPLWNGSEY